MPLNIPTIIDQSQLPYPGWFWVCTVVAYVLIVPAIVLVRSDRDSLFITGCVMGFAAIACFAVPRVHHYLAERDAALSTITQQVQSRYNLDINSDMANNLRTQKNLPVRVYHGHRVYMLDVLDDGTVTVTDADGNLVQPSH